MNSRFGGKPSSADLRISSLAQFCSRKPTSGLLLALALLGSRRYAWLLTLRFAATEGRGTRPGVSQKLPKESVEEHRDKLHESPVRRVVVYRDGRFRKTALDVSTISTTLIELQSGSVEITKSVGLIVSRFNSTTMIKDWSILVNPKPGFLEAAERSRQSHHESSFSSLAFRATSTERAFRPNRRRY